MIIMIIMNKGILVFEFVMDRWFAGCSRNEELLCTLILFSAVTCRRTRTPAQIKWRAWLYTKLMYYIRPTYCLIQQCRKKDGKF